MVCHELNDAVIDHPEFGSPTYGDLHVLFAKKAKS